MERVKAVKEILMGAMDFYYEDFVIFEDKFPEVITQICQLFERPKVKLPENPYYRNDNFNKRLVFNEALQQIKEALEKVGVEVE